MSNIALFPSGAQLPAHLRGVEDFTKTISGTGDGRTISIEGGVWRMLVGGEEISRNEDRAMNFVFINAAPDVARTYYVGTYVKGQTASPDCFSANGKVPDANAPAPQSTACATCPQNIKGSGQNDSRACRFSRRFAVLLENDISGDVYRLQLPAKSLFGNPKAPNKMPMQAYAKFLHGHQVPMSGVVTEARFDTDESVPVLTFQALRPLTEAEFNSVKLKATSDDAMRAIDTTYVVKEAPAGALPFDANSVPRAAAPAPAAPVAPVAPVAEPAVAPPVRRGRPPRAAAPVPAQAAPAAPAPAQAAPAAPAPAAPAPASTSVDVASVLDAWGDDDE